MRLNDWKLAYTPKNDGYSFETMLRKINRVGNNLIIV